MTDDVTLSVSQFHEAWRVLCARGPAPRGESSGGVDFVFSGLPNPFFNVALPSGGPLTADALASRARRAREWAAGAGVPWLFIVTRELLEPGVDAAAVLEPCGLAPALTLTGMAADDVAPPAARADGLSIAEPHDRASCDAIIDVNANAYGMDLEACKPSFTPEFWAAHVPMLGLADGVPVASSAVMMVDGCRYVAMVATLQSHQRRGYAEAVMRRSLEVAARRHGMRPTVLHATEAGRPVYARMGYRTIANHVAFVEGAPAAH